MNVAPIAANAISTSRKAALAAVPRRFSPRRMNHSTSGLIASARKSEMRNHTTTGLVAESAWRSSQTATTMTTTPRTVRARKETTLSGIGTQHPPRTGRFQYAAAAVTSATIHTTKGDIDVELFDDDAPKTVANFTKLAGDGFYDGVIFHRVIPDFMIQGGDPTGTGSGGPGYQFEDEFNDNKVERGALAMANAGPNTNGSQFFIVTADACPWLDGKHTVFGRVTNGMDVVDAISAADRDPRDRPREDVVMERVSLG